MSDTAYGCNLHHEGNRNERQDEICLKSHDRRDYGASVKNFQKLLSRGLANPVWK
jgi:hypothetical protein